MADQPGQLIGQLNPVTHAVEYHHAVTPGGIMHAATLYDISMRVVRKHVTLQRLQQAESLMIPRELIREMKMVSLREFRINPEGMTAENHHERAFPAFCLIDNSEVLIRVTGRDFPAEDDPAYIMTLVCGDVSCHFYSHTYHLGELIHRASLNQLYFSEAFVWRIIQQVATLANSLPIDTQIHPRHFHMKDEHLFYRAPVLPTSDVTYLYAEPVTLYEAPEVLKREPLSEKALSWTIGCIAYELVTLKPAFHNQDRSRDVVELMTDIMQGKLPPLIENLTYSDALLNMISRCLSRQTSARPTLEEIITTSTLHQTE